MKALDVVTVVGNKRFDTKQAEPIAPGIVLAVTEAEGRKPSLLVVTAMDGGEGIGLVGAPLRDLPHVDDDPTGTFRWREYDPADFNPAEPDPAVSGAGSGQAEGTPPA